MTVWVNGRVATVIDVRDRGLQYGDGLFETMRVQGGRVRLLDYHLDRLIAGCRRLVLPPPSRPQLRAEVLRAAAAHGNAIAKLIVTRGAGVRGYRAPTPCRPTRILIVDPQPPQANVTAGAPVRVRLCQTRIAVNPVFAGLKTLNRLESVVARNEWRDPRISEGLLQDTDGHIVCGTMTNVFVGRNGRIVTPTLDRCGVAGVMRRWILETGEALGVSIAEGRVGIDDLRNADEVFLSNAVIGIWSVGAIVNPKILSRPGEFTAADMLRARWSRQA
jgi:4-amino-4-deoxychorismate lyase